jgi:hypothetical protein
VDRCLFGRVFEERSGYSFLPLFASLSTWLGSNFNGEGRELVLKNLTEKASLRVFGRNQLVREGRENGYTLPSPRANLERSAMTLVFCGVP